MKVEVVNMSNNKLPEYETKYSAGLDVRADFSRVTPTNPLKLFGDGEIIFETEVTKIPFIRLDPGARVLIPTGLKVKIPEGYEIQVRPRSGLAIKKGITVLNTPGTIDSDYVNEIGIILINNGLESVYIDSGERVAQLVLNKVERIDWEEVSALEDTERKGGFGSTGTK